MVEEIAQTTFIDPFVDFSFKRLFSSEQSKPILIGLLNHLFRGRKFITEIEYGKNEFPGENAEEGGVVFDVYCTDADGSRYIIEIQRGYQKHFKERSLFYASRAISEQAPKGNRKGWAYNLTEVYLIAFLEDFILPGSSKSEYVHDICLADKSTGKIFYDKLSLIFISMLNFVKEPHELDTKLDKWIYALKHLAEFKQRPEYLSGPELDQLFNLAEYANLTRKERDMYNASLKYKWDNKNVRDYEVNKGREEGKAEGREQGKAEGREQGKAEGREEERAKAREEKLEMAIEMLADNEPIDKIAKYTKLSRKEIEALV